VTEALSAGIPVVASDIPVHREAAARVGVGGAIFVSPEGSPLEVADALAVALRPRGLVAAPMTVPSWDGVADTLLGLYGAPARITPARITPDLAARA
jgi:hypothetical protein